MGTPKRDIDAPIKDRHLGGSTADGSEEKKREKLLPPIEAKQHKDFLSQPGAVKAGGVLAKPGSKSVIKPLTKGAKK